jgi:hypothetical protein
MYYSLNGLGPVIDPELEKTAEPLGPVNMTNMGKTDAADKSLGARAGRAADTVKETAQSVGEKAKTVGNKAVDTAKSVGSAAQNLGDAVKKNKKAVGGALGGLAGLGAALGLGGGGGEAAKETAEEAAEKGSKGLMGQAKNVGSKALNAAKRNPVGAGIAGLGTLAGGAGLMSMSQDD